MTGTAKSTGRTTAKDTQQAFTAEERAAMKERAREVRAASRGGGAAADPGVEVLAKIAEMSEPDRGMAEKVHAIVMANAPDLTPRLWYGMPAYAKAGKVICFFQPAEKFKARYSTLGFNDSANLDDGSMWPTAFALTKLTAADEERIGELVRAADR
jgi:uncharacterized protein YdhG (YjbR/CyaY superfamily)